MDYIFRLATRNDFEEIVTLYQCAIKMMCAQGIEQWDDIYPNKEVLRDDIRNRQMFLLSFKNQIAAAIVLNEKQDDAYKTGNWSCNTGKIAVIHRLCVHPDFQGKGLGSETVKRCEQLLIKTGYDAIRLDTFLKNSMAMHLYRSLGYQKAGEVIFRKGNFCLFEKRLHTEV